MRPLLKKSPDIMLESFPLRRLLAPNAPAMLLHAALAVAFFGLFVSAVLSLGHFLDLPVPCGDDNGCGAVAAHPAATILGIPIAVVGVGVYTVQLFLLARPATARKARRIFVGLALAGTLASAALLLYSQWVIRATCVWCCASGVAMLALLVLGLRLQMLGPNLPGPRSGLVWTFGFITALAIGLQAGQMERAANRAPVSQEILGRLDVTELDDPAKSVGSNDAPVSVIVFADFFCPACRAALGPLLRYQQAHPNDVRVVYRHLPLWQIRGHETSKAAAALSEMAAEHGKFWRFVDALHSHAGRVNRTEYLEIMRGLGFDTVSVERRLETADDTAILNVERDIALAEKLAIRTTPTFVVKVESHPPVSAGERRLGRILNSAAVTSLLTERAERRLATRQMTVATPIPGSQRR